MTARVLVVDDEPDAEPLFRQQFRREVREGLYQLDFARSAETALHMLDGYADEIVLLLLDINMPGMSGLDLLLKIKERKPRLPVFVISVYGDADTVATALKRGADEFLTKPVEFAKLRRDIKAVIARGGMDDGTTG
jgi:DNA-binding NtrC family response regulator